MPESSATVVGLVLGSQDATPLEFWVGVREGERAAARRSRRRQDARCADGDDGDASTASSTSCGSASRAASSTPTRSAWRTGRCPSDVSYAAHVQVTRVEPEVFVPPAPGRRRSRSCAARSSRRALYFDRMERSVAIGLTRTGEPVYANLEFLDGTRGAHASISGVSGVATKTSLRHVPALLAVPLRTRSGSTRPTRRRSSSTSRARTCSGSTSRTRG